MKINYTGSKTDFAIQDEGYFIVGSVNGKRKYYTKNGHFSKTKEGNLVTESGMIVLGLSPNKLLLQPVFYKENVEKDTIAIAYFQPEQPLKKVKSSYYVPKEKGVEPTIRLSESVVAESLESNENPAKELVELFVEYKKNKKE